MTNIRRPLPFNSPFQKNTNALRSLWLRLKAFMYRVCDSQFFHVQHFLALKMIEFPFYIFNRGSLVAGHLLDCLHTTKHRHKREVELFQGIKHPMLHFLYPSESQGALVSPLY